MPAPKDLASAFALSPPMRGPRRTLLLVATLAVAVTAAIALRQSRPPAPGRTPSPQDRTTDIATRFLALESSENEAAQRDFAPELAATPAAESVATFWDELNRAQDPLASVANLDWPALRIASPRPAPPGPARFASLPPTNSWPAHEWQAQLRRWHDAGWRIRRTRWFLESFDARDQTAQVRFEILAENPALPARIQLSGLATSRGPAPFPASSSEIVLQELSCLRAEGAPPWKVVADLEIPVPPHTPFCDPILAVPRRDGRGDDLLLAGAAVWFRNTRQGWQRESLPGLPNERIWAAAVADWDRDGHPDLLLAATDGVRWLRGPDWAGPGEPLWRSPTRIRHPQSLAVSDIDGDGDLDLFLAQYKLPYQGGQFPTPYHDANDGFESHLLRNDGPAGLTDATRAAGLGAKRLRRAYSASFADWNDDGRPDLVVVSDFAGVDLYRNRGDGTFEDLTHTLGDTRHLFGMAHATGDFDDDGRSDLLAIGMDSPVARRLDRMGAVHRGFDGDRRLRPAMTFGNRLYLGRDSGLAQASWAGQLARGGWAWAVTPLDFDNDGGIDFHLCNGHETRASVRDYERQFWLHDIHVAASSNNPVAEVYFRNAAGRRAAEQASYGGWQHGAFFVRTAPATYSDLGWLLGTALFADTRNAVATDFDLDGRMDLAVTTLEEWPAPRQRLVLLRNGNPQPGNWIGFEAPDRTALDWRIRVTAGGVTRERRITAGESYRSQAVGRFHFGLGNAATVERVEIRRPGDGWRPVEGAKPNQWNPLPR